VRFFIGIVKVKAFWSCFHESSSKYDAGNGFTERKLKTLMGSHIVLIDGSLDLNAPKIFLLEFSTQSVQS
jgi:hypothetical protein